MRITTTAIAVLAAVATSSAAPPAPATAPAATGHLKLIFSEHSPLSGRDESYMRYGALKVPPPDPQWAQEVDLPNEPFDVFVPPAYRPNVPHGIFIWMGVTEFSPEWFNVLARHRLIFLKAGCINEKTESGKVRKNLDGIYNLGKRYNVDEKRIYLAGFSGGASEASFDLVAYPDAFHGAMLLMGGGVYATMHDDNRRAVCTADLRSQWKAPLDEIKRDFPIVLMRGQRDEFGDHANAQYEALILDGFVRATFLEVPNIGHQHPDASWFEKAVVALDHPQLKKPPTTAPTKDPRPLPSQIAQAKRYISSAQHWLDMKNFWPKSAHQRAEDTARSFLQQVMELYPTTPSAAKARTMIRKLDEAREATTAPARP